jgi:hypothetical protein
MEGATDLNELLGASGPVQNPSLPQSTTFAPMVTGGGDPFIAPINNKPASVLQNNVHMFSTAKQAVKNAAIYFGFFVAAALISLATPRSLILQYIPNTYTSGGVPSYTGVGILAGVAVLVAYVIGSLFNLLI